MKNLFLMLVVASLVTLVAAIPVFADPPAASGPIIVRGEEVGAFHYSDARTGLGIIVGADINEFCNGIVDFDPVSVQNIDVPADADRLVQTYGTHGSYDVTVSVWPFMEFDCEKFATVDPLASGKVSLQGGDNDLYASSGANWNAWGYTARGQLTKLDGSPAQVSTSFRSIWDGDDPNTVVWVTRINLTD